MHEDSSGDLVISISLHLELATVNVSMSLNGGAPRPGSVFSV
jgi:hypothetical protein